MSTGFNLDEIEGRLKVEMEENSSGWGISREYQSDVITDMLALINEVQRLRLTAATSRAEVRRDALLEAANLACLYCKNNIPLRRVEDNRICLTGYVHIVRQSYQPECYAGLIHQAITAADQGQGQGKE